MGLPSYHVYLHILNIAYFSIWYMGQTSKYIMSGWINEWIHNCKSEWVVYNLIGEMQSPLEPQKREQKLMTPCWVWDVMRHQRKCFESDLSRSSMRFRREHWTGERFHWKDIRECWKWVENTAPADWGLGLLREICSEDYGKAMLTDFSNKAISCTIVV